MEAINVFDDMLKFKIKLMNVVFWREQRTNLLLFVLKRFVDLQSVDKRLENDLVQLVAHFVKNGVDVNAQNSLLETALHYAVKLDFFKLTEVLLSLGAKSDIMDVNGKTPRDIASPKMQRFLFEKTRSFWQMFFG